MLSGARQSGRITKNFQKTVIDNRLEMPNGLTNLNRFKWDISRLLFNRFGFSEPR